MEETIKICTRKINWLHQKAGAPEHAPNLCSIPEALLFFRNSKIIIECHE